MAKPYHIDLERGALEGARHALLPGDPGRVPRIARALDGQARELGWKREFRSFLAKLDGRAVLIVSTGIGGASASIAVDELARLGVDTFLRVGTTGALQDHIALGDVVITTGSVRLDGASSHYAPIEFPAVAHHDLVAALVVAAREEGVPFHVGVTASTDTFYPGQERSDSFSGYVPRRFVGQTEELRRMHVLNYEMESATILTMGAVLGLRAGCVTGVAARRTVGEHVAPEAAEMGERSAIRVAARAIRRLL